MAEKVEWPKWMYGPGGEGRIFQKDDKIPRGWQDHPSKVKEEAPKAATSKSKVSEKDRKSTIESLREAGVEISDDASDAEVQAALDSLIE